MSEKEKNLIRQLSETIPKLDNEKQNYILGLVEGMVLSKDTQREEQLQEA